MKEIKILLLYPPEQSWPGTMLKLGIHVITKSSKL